MDLCEKTPIKWFLKYLEAVKAVGLLSSTPAIQYYQIQTCISGKNVSRRNIFDNFGPSVYLPSLAEQDAILQSQ
jgi:hypothetical protein|tara:strand:+ start:10229 stop:10450 length:222 start_codon:yes stop_codon:yes gene_type:complete